MPHMGMVIINRMKVLTSGATSSSSRVLREFYGFFKVPGPAIIKLQAIANAADIDCSTSFDLVLTTP